MSTDAVQTGSNVDWGSLFDIGGKSVSEGMQSAAKYGASKRDLKEAKRRQLAKMLEQSLRRDQSLYRGQQDYSDELSDYKNQAIQQVARGFVDALKGSTRGR